MRVRGFEHEENGDLEERKLSSEDLDVIEADTVPEEGLMSA